MKAIRIKAWGQFDKGTLCQKTLLDGKKAPAVYMTRKVALEMRQCGAVVRRVLVTIEEAIPDRRLTKLTLRWGGKLNAPVGRKDESGGLNSGND